MPYGSDSLVVTRDGQCAAVDAAAREVMMTLGAEGATLPELAASIAARVPRRDGFLAGMESVRGLIECGAMVSWSPSGLPGGQPGLGAELADRASEPGRASATAEAGMVWVAELGLPWSAFAAAPATVAELVGEVLASPGRRLLEFGPGLSTVAVGLAADFAGVEVEVVGIEQDPAWASALVEALPDSPHVSASLALAPLVPALADRAPFHMNRWYDRDALGEVQGPFSVVLVDGPTAFRFEWRYDRWPALDFVLPLLAEGATIVLDDANREGEGAIGRDWVERLGPGWHASMVDRSLWLRHTAGK
ncbi:MAG: hypothetical protein QG597_3849 [Actinomycetota bacterium]|nr:hypothetical protein [Actinomycetota bacterium]